MNETRIQHRPAGYVACGAAPEAGRWHSENELETDAQAKPRRWFRCPWFKILTFIFATPVWVIIVWLDPDEKRGIKVFAGVVMALGIAITVFRNFGPEAQARKALQREWNEADGASRLEMLADSASHSAFDLLGDATREEVIALLGAPDAATDDGGIVYRLDSTNESGICTFKFSPNGRLSEMSTQGRRGRIE